VRLDSFGHEGPLSPGILDRVQLLPEIRASPRSWAIPRRTMFMAYQAMFAVITPR
jgi:hypothetical protein